MGYELFTIGYEGASQMSLLKTLLYHDVEVIVDIREITLSRKPGLSKKGLTLAASDYKMKYIHVRALGTPRDIRYQRKIDHDQEAFREQYSAYLATQDEAVDALVSLAKENRCCLLCYEADARVCHRWIVAERVSSLTNGAVQPTHLEVMMPSKITPNS